MPLNAIARAMLAHMNANPIDWASIAPQQFRAMSAGMEQPADPSDAIVQEDVDAGGVPARIYRRAEAAGPEPVLLFFHGGGYIACGISSHERLCSRLARRAECAIVSVDYRLAPEHVFPAAVDDALAALRWLGEHGGKHGLDTDRIAVGGDSAGGSLATVAAIRSRDEGGPAIRHQLLFYPGTDLTGETESERLYSDGYFLDSDFSAMCLDAYLPNPADRAHPWASPLLTPDLSGLPPATILTAECDPLRDEGRAYADRLRASGVPVRYKDYPGVFHGFVSMFGMLPDADETIADAARELQQAFAEIPA
ncbi:MAG: alpha/beta hydrolase [Rhizorhabdus sp.]|uniref:alpha/beta hydrolase n=1 Tax=Rhizorhabdus sp. TaxID=1968843 RepID=UPI001B6B13E4|nr:alpha/beta hydrolase [Rhizorhabdus sp.]MBP8231834.1 alpha/beta hydrolase [Rhizorhabdus sp.]